MIDAQTSSRLVEDANGCYVWTGHVARNGYGKVHVGRTVWLIHRYVYTEMVGPIPDGLVIDHLCRNRACANPEHLEPVTTRVNLLRGETITAKCAAKTECPSGHPYDAENTRVRNGKRQCKTCTRRRLAAFNAKVSAARALQREGASH